MATRLTTKEFIKRSLAIHKGKYLYDKVKYISSGLRVIITCKIHGDFEQIANSHLLGKGCQKCHIEKTSKINRLTQEEVLRRCKKKHGNTYDYSKVVYVNTKTKIIIGCKEHGEFLQTPKNHMLGQGCPKCGKIKKAKNKVLNQAEVLEKFKEAHNGFYDYSNVNYIGNKKLIKITCPLHGPFLQTPDNHKHNHGCPECGRSRTTAGISYTQDIIIKKFREKHGDLYSYYFVNYTGTKNQVEIICPIHGSFLQTPEVHLLGCGCPKCSIQTSKGEDAIAKFLTEFLKVKTRIRGIIGKKELDIFIPEKNIAIEYNGSYWHSEKIAKNPKWHLLTKQKQCAALGIRLIHVSDYENPTIVKKTLSHILGIDKEKYYARKCTIEIRSSNEAGIKNFLNNNHLQGAVKGCTAYCLKHNNSLVACMLFSKTVSERGNKDSTRWELRRFSSNCRVIGGASRLLKAFFRDNTTCKSLISYSDNQWFTGKMYEVLGFTCTKVLNPDYKYIKGSTVLPKNHFCRARMATREGFDFRPEESEKVNAERNGWFRLWDCGKTKWEIMRSL